MARVILAYNLIKPEMLRQGPLDRTAELDSEDTIAALVAALEAGRHQVIPLDVGEDICSRLCAEHPDVVFNIAEGLRGESREAQLPALCEMFGIPYTGSGVLTLATCLNKARTKEIIAHHGIETAPFQVMQAPDEPLDARLHFPLIVKLMHEGSSMGLSENSIVDDALALRCQAEIVWEQYRGPLLIEEFIEGREFTVGVLGNESPVVLPIAEYVFHQSRGIMLFIPDDPVLEALVRERDGAVPHFEAKYTFVCPAAVTPALRTQIEVTALATYKVLGLRDWGRMEMRLGLDGQLYVLEVNPIAGIDPTYALPKQAYAAGMSYADLVNGILHHAMARYGLDD
jgi:D-alanine-D-alanine ligase-like ATP-grasp enzyme